MASLDHAMWFHRPFRADDWLLYDQVDPVELRRAGPGRGLDLHRGGQAGRIGDARRTHPASRTELTAGRRVGVGAAGRLGVQRRHERRHVRHRDDGGEHGAHDADVGRAAPRPHRPPTTAPAPDAPAITATTAAPPPRRQPTPDLGAVKVKLTPVAAADRAHLVANRPATPPRSTSPSAAARLRALRDGALVDRRSSTSAPRSPPAASAASSASPSPPTAATSTSTTPTATATATSTSTPSGPTARSTPPPGARSCSSTNRSPTTTAASILFGPDGYLYIGFGDGGSAGDPKRNGLNLGTLAGQDPAHRPACQRRPALHRAARQPLRRAGRRPTRDLVVRPAQPVALLVRQGHQRPVDRRRRPEATSKRSTVATVADGAGTRHQLRAGARSRAATATTRTSRPMASSGRCSSTRTPTATAP